MNATDAATVLLNSTPRDNLLKDYGELLGALIASSMALYIAAGGADWFKRHFVKPKLEIIKNIRRYKQAHDVWRISIKNEGNDIAHDVQAVVTKITMDGKERENFVPMPLTWTHRESDSRDILPDQTVYLDIIEHYVNTSEKEVHIASPRGHGVSDFRNIGVSSELTVMEITIYERRGRALTLYIEIGHTAPLFLDARVRGKSWNFGIYKTKG